jgi:hypothetical protein
MPFWTMKITFIMANHKEYFSYYVAILRLYLKNIDHHLKLNISMYYSTILIRIRSDFDPTSHHIQHPNKSASVNTSV